MKRWYFFLIVSFSLGMYAGSFIRKEFTMRDLIKRAKEDKQKPIVEYLNVGKHKIIGVKKDLYNSYNGLPLEDIEQAIAVTKVLLLSGVVEEKFERCFGRGKNNITEEWWSYYTYTLRKDLITNQ